MVCAGDVILKPTPTYQGHGLGLRSSFAAELERGPKACDWLEAISDNFLYTLGPARERLLRLRRQYPLALHGVGLGIGNAGPVDFDYLQRLKDLIGQTQPLCVSDHLCWGAFGGHHSHDLLPLPMTPEVVDHVAVRLRQVQDFLGTQLLLENPSTYARFEGTQMPEWQFLREVAERADCGILLDLNNVVVNARNHGFAAERYIDGICMDRVGQIHLAGYADMGTHYLDTHGAPVPAAVWALYDAVMAAHGDINTLVEWDEDVPALPVLQGEVQRARQIAQRARRSQQERSTG